MAICHILGCHIYSIVLGLLLVSEAIKYKVILEDRMAMESPRIMYSHYSLRKKVSAPPPAQSSHSQARVAVAKDPRAILNSPPVFEPLITLQPMASFSVAKMNSVQLTDTREWVVFFKLMLYILVKK